MRERFKLKIKYLSRFDRIRLTKPKRVIDASIFLETIEEKQPICAKYLGKASYDYIAHVTIPIFGEIFLGIARLPDDSLREKAFKFILELVKEKRVDVIPIQKDRDKFIPELLDCVSKIPIDDLTHISNIINAGFKEFVTIDQKINQDNIKQVLQERFELKIINPTRI